MTFFTRWMIQKDYVTVAEIDKFISARTGCCHWDVDAFLENLRNRAVIGMVAEGREREPLGFVVYELKKRSLDLLNFGVHPDSEGMGVGTTLINKLKFKVCSHRREVITATVRDGNLPMQKFLRRHGFVAHAVYRDCYGTGEDGYRFAWNPTPADRDRAGFPLSIPNETL